MAEVAAEVAARDVSARDVSARDVSARGYIFGIVHVGLPPDESRPRAAVRMYACCSPIRSEHE